MPTTLRLNSKGPEVKKLQEALNAYGIKPPLVPDSHFGPLTKAAVEKFQRAKGLVPDGVVGPLTWAALTGTGAAASQHTDTSANQTETGGFYFPLGRVPPASWTTGGRYFGAPRRNGRLHAGCDLLGPTGDPIYAISEGTLVRGPYQFTNPKMGLPVTDAVEIRHGDLLIRYGEIQPGSYVGGRNVTGGQRIASIGALRMLHLEIYTRGNDTSGLSSSANAYRRRSDVTNPDPYLQKWVKNLPGR